MRRLAAAPLVVGALVAALVGTLVMPSPSSEAFWSARTTGGSSAAQATTVQRVGTPTATVATQNDVTVSWSATTLSDGTAVSGYTVARTDGSGTTVAATGSCGGTVVATSCTEADVPDGRWTYTVVARFAASWVGPASAASATVVADTVAPTNAFTVSVTTGRASLQGTTLWYRGAGNGELRIVNAVSDALSGPGSSSTGALAGTATGWSHIPTNVSAPAGGPFASAPFTWEPGTSTAPTTDIVGFDVAGNQVATRIQLRDDSTPPSGGAIGYPAGTVRPSSPGSSASVPVNAASVADAGGSGVVDRVFQRRTATLTGDTCGAFGGWSQIASTAVTFDVAFNDTVGTGTCVQYRHLVEDAVGNVREAASSNVVKVKPTSQSVVAGTANLVDSFRFDSSNLLANSASGASGRPGTTTSSSTRPSASSDVPFVAEPGTSAFFDGTDDFVRTQRTIQDSFTIELWFRSDNGGKGIGSQWYNGAGLVDAEVGGVANDFGIALMADGRVLAGVGNHNGTDRTIASQAGLANNVWHHVVMTRNQTNGVVELWIDGVSVGTVTAGTQSLTASASIDLGRLQTNVAGQYYRGNLDEVAMYSRVLSASEIQTHFANAR
ncbi:LamG domain-containing protein [Agrococcus jejuensis]|uniref:LamG domain-containing protein n=1 Tax=Agrococcus jejuensis TaxID=399736 RepID=UPI00164250A4|nr:LamG domain-containing protein [Agrococcus jejuensis]